MAACQTLKKYSRRCGKNAKAGLKADVYLIAFDDLTNVAGSTEVFTESVTGLIDEIALLAPANVFVKYGAVVNQNSLKETFTANDNGTYDIVKELAFSLTDVANVDGKKAVEDLFGQPVAALVNFQSGAWVAVGLNGQFQLKTSEGTVDASNNGRVLTISGSDGVLLQPVDPTIIADLITAA